MKIISLNTWGGRGGKEGLLDFFKHHREDTDVFCLQEIWSAPYKDHEGQYAGGRPIEHAEILINGVRDISEILSDHTPFFHPHYLDNYGLMMLVKKEYTIRESGDVFVYHERGYIPTGDVGNHARNIQYATCTVDGNDITFINFHGLWTDKEEGRGKQDIPERIKQSENILAFTRTLKNPFILCGDFNLLPTTESIKKIEEAGLRNLIKEYNVSSTRTSHYTKPEKFADYAFVSHGLTVNDFKVLPDVVSDHSPLFIDIEFPKATSLA